MAAVPLLLSEVRRRTQATISIRLQDADALFLAVVAGGVEAAELIECAFEGEVRREATAGVAALGLTTDEFGALFRPSACPASRQLVLACERPEARRAFARLEAALSTTLAVEAQRALWQKSLYARVGAYLALCRPSDAVECLSSVLGGVVHADGRQLDDLRQSVEDAGLDLLMVSDLVRSAISCVTL